MHVEYIRSLDRRLIITFWSHRKTDLSLCSLSLFSKSLFTDFLNWLSFSTESVRNAGTNEIKCSTQKAENGFFFIMPAWKWVQKLIIRILSGIKSIWTQQTFIFIYWRCHNYYRILSYGGCTSSASFHAKLLRSLCIEKERSSGHFGQTLWNLILCSARTMCC